QTPFRPGPKEEILRRLIFLLRDLTVMKLADPATIWVRFTLHNGETGFSRRIGTGGSRNTLKPKRSACRIPVNPFAEGPDLTMASEARRHQSRNRDNKPRGTSHLGFHFDFFVVVFGLGETPSILPLRHPAYPLPFCSQTCANRMHTLTASS